MSNQTSKSPQILSNFALRIIAMVSMVIDHVGVLMLNYWADFGPGASNVYYVLRILGRLAFPLFIFMLAEGMHYTRSKWKYLGRIFSVYSLIILALIIYIFAIAQNPSLVHDTFPGTNPFTDLVLLGLVLLFLNSGGWKKALAILPAGIIITAHVCSFLESQGNMTITWFPYFLRPDYGLFGLGITLAFYLARPIGDFLAKRACAAYALDYEGYRLTPEYQRGLNGTAIALFAGTVILFWGLSYVSFDPLGMSLESWCLLIAPILFFYSGKRGYNATWFRIFSYAFFPMHLIILFLIFFVSFGHV